MFKNLVPGALGISLPFETAAALARRYGFEGIDPPLDLARERGVDTVRALLAAHDLRPGGFALPVRWNADEETWRSGLARLGETARLAREIGTDRCYTWVPPASNERPYDENFAFHVARLRPIAEILGEAGCRLGLEFIGPATSRRNARYPFIWTIAGMLELAGAVGPNVGLLVDSWHWYTAEQSVADLEALSAEQVVYVHVNDAPAGIPVSEQIDNVRCLPGETAVIEIGDFLAALEAIGYDGPVTPEPFSQKLREMEPEQAIKLAGHAMDTIWAVAGWI